MIASYNGHLPFSLIGQAATSRASVTYFEILSELPAAAPDVLGVSPAVTARLSIYASKGGAKVHFALQPNLLRPKRTQQDEV